MEATHENIRAYVERVSDFSFDDDGNNWISFATRDNGNVGDETYGVADYEHGLNTIRLVEHTFDGIQSNIETCDEWVNISFTF